METRFVEATQDAAAGFNWGKFMVGRFDADEQARPSELMQREAAEGDARVGIDRSAPGRAYTPVGLLRARGWSPDHVVVFDLETCEGAAFSPGGSASADLAKHKIWVCPMFEPFLAWLYEWIESYRQSARLSTSGLPRSVLAAEWFDALPAIVELPGAPAAVAGYRREGRG